MTCIFTNKAQLFQIINPKRPANEADSVMSRKWSILSWTPNNFSVYFYISASDIQATLLQKAFFYWNHLDCCQLTDLFVSLHEGSWTSYFRIMWNPVSSSPLLWWITQKLWVLWQKTINVYDYIYLYIECIIVNKAVVYYILHPYLWCEQTCCIFTVSLTEKKKKKRKHIN